jgi:hypothetical protein
MSSGAITARVRMFLKPGGAILGCSIRSSFLACGSKVLSFILYFVFRSQSEKRNTD